MDYPGVVLVPCLCPAPALVPGPVHGQEVPEAVYSLVVFRCGSFLVTSLLSGRLLRRVLIPSEGIQFLTSISVISRWRAC